MPCQHGQTQQAVSRLAYSRLAYTEAAPPCVTQAALVSVAASPITLLVISIADFSRHATPEVLRVMRDEVHCPKAPSLSAAASHAWSATWWTH